MTPIPDKREADDFSGFPEQLTLPTIEDGLELLALTADDFSGKSEASKLPLSTVGKNVERVRAIVQAIAAGLSLIQIQKTFQVGYHTLKELQGKHLKEIAEHKERLARKFEFAAEMQVDRVISNPEALDINRAFMTAGTFVDKALILRGEANSISRTLNEGPTPEQFASYIAGLKSAKMGSEGRDGGEQKGVVEGELIED